MYCYYLNLGLLKKMVKKIFDLHWTHFHIASKHKSISDVLFMLRIVTIIVWNIEDCKRDEAISKHGMINTEEERKVMSSRKRLE